RYIGGLSRTCPSASTIVIPAFIGLSPCAALAFGRPRRVAAFYSCPGVDHQPRGAPAGRWTSLGARIAAERPGWCSTGSRPEGVAGMASRTNGARRDDAAARYSDFAHTGPGTLAGRLMRTFWQPVARARDLPAGHAKPIRVMSEDFTLYR